MDHFVFYWAEKCSSKYIFFFFKRFCVCYKVEESCYMFASSSSKGEESYLLFSLFKKCYVTCLWFTDSAWMNFMENIMYQINVCRSNSIAQTVWQEKQLCAAALLIMMFVGLFSCEQMAMYKSTLIYYTLFLPPPGFQLSLSVHLSLSSKPLPPIFINSLSFALMFPLSPLNTSIHLWSSTLITDGCSLFYRPLDAAGELCL